MTTQPTPGGGNAYTEIERLGAAPLWRHLGSLFLYREELLA